MSLITEQNCRGCVLHPKEHNIVTRIMCRGSLLQLAALTLHAQQCAAYDAQQQQQHLLHRAPVIGQAQPYVFTGSGHSGSRGHSDDRRASPPARDVMKPPHWPRGLLGNYSADDVLSIRCRLCNVEYNNVQTMKKHFQKVEKLSHFQPWSMSEQGITVCSFSLTECALFLPGSSSC